MALNNPAVIASHHFWFPTHIKRNAIRKNALIRYPKDSKKNPTPKSTANVRQILFRPPELSQFSFFFFACLSRVACVIRTKERAARIMPKSKGKNPAWGDVIVPTGSCLIPNKVAIESPSRKIPETISVFIRLYALPHPAILEPCLLLWLPLSYLVDPWQ